MIDCKENKLKLFIHTNCLLACLNFYGKTMANTANPSRLFSTFCIPSEQSELIWHSFTVPLPENITMVNKFDEM
jgi:hypothetical protein